MQVDPVDAMAARDQRPTEPIEKIRDRPLQKQKRTGLRGLRAPLDIEFGVASVALHVYARSKADTGPQGRQRWRPSPKRASRSTDFQ